MFLANWKKKKMIVQQMDGGGWDGILPYDLRMRATDGTWIYRYNESDSPYSARRAISFYNEYPRNVLLGIGNTPVTAEDYCLEHQINSSLASVSFSRYYKYDANTNEAVLTFTVNGTNATAEPITICEIGFTIYGGCSTATENRDGTGSSTSSDYGKECMYIRHVLENPVTVEAGGVFSITIETRE